MPKAIPNRVTTQLRIDETLHHKAKIIADREERTLNSQYEYSIKKMVEAYERENGSIPVDVE